jgi:UrcA family protein
MSATRNLITVLASVAATALLVSAPARADNQNVEVTKIPIHFGDLDLDTHSGAHSLYLRLSGAARLACGSEPNVVDLAEMRQANRCQQAAIEKAVAQVDRPQLTALYDAHYPREPLTEASRVALLSQTPSAFAAR